MTHAVYQYRPLSIWALGNLLQHDVFGEQARVKQFQADMLYVIACGNRIDGKAVQHFGAMLERIYHNPFKHKYTDNGEQIVKNILGE